jgi:hypothetical protein
MIRQLCRLTIVLVICGSTRVALAHGVVGDYMFLEPVVAEDPTPANEFDILQPSWVRSADANTYSIGFSLEKVLYIDSQDMPRFSIGGGNSWQHISPYEDAGEDGFGNLELFAKYAFFYSLDHQFMMTVGVELDLPVGNSSIQNQNHTSLGPLLLVEKGMGDIPNRPFLKYLRPFGIQSDFGYVPALGGHTSHLMFADGVLEYSLPYLSNNVADIGLTWPFRNIFLFSEINFEQLITGPSGETFPILLATPGLAYVGYKFEFAVGTQFALNNASRPGNHASVVAVLDLFYDSIFPKLGNWTINRGFGG